MITSELAATLKERYPGLRRSDSVIAVNTVIARMRQTLVEGHRIELRGFGSLKVRERMSRVYRHPLSRKLMPPGAVLRVVKFRPTKTLKEALKRDPVGTCAPGGSGNVNGGDGGDVTSPPPMR